MGFEREQKDSDQLRASHQKATTFLADSMPQTLVHKQEEQPARKTWTGETKPGERPGRPVSSPPELASGRGVARLVITGGCLQSGAATPTRKLLHRRLTVSSPTSLDVFTFFSGFSCWLAWRGRTVSVTFLGLPLAEGNEARKSLAPRLRFSAVPRLSLRFKRCYHAPRSTPFVVGRIFRGPARTCQ